MYHLKVAQHPLTSPCSCALWTHFLSFSMKQAANIPLVCELGIDKLYFDDFSLDMDAMITAALRMFMELGMVQKFKIDYEVRQLHLFPLNSWQILPRTLFLHQRVFLITAVSCAHPSLCVSLRRCAGGCWRSERTTEWFSITTGDMPSTSASACLPC